MAKITLKDPNDDLILERNGVSIRVLDILSSLIIPAEGDVQIFDNPECTRYATGVKNPGDKVYARVNVPWGFDGGWTVGDSSNPGNYLIFATPTTEYPDNLYYIHAWKNFTSGDDTQPFTQGQIVELNWKTQGASIDVTNYQKVFTNPNPSEWIFEPGLPSTDSEFRLSRRDGKAITDDNLPNVLRVRLDGEIYDLQKSIDSSIKYLDSSGNSIYEMRRDDFGNPSGILERVTSTNYELIKY